VKKYLAYSQDFDNEIAILRYQVNTLSECE
jgi:hypothetical protein